MEFGEILKTIEEYGSQYVRYLVSITEPAKFKTRSEDLEPKIFVFSLLSGLIAFYYYETFVARINPDANLYLSALVINVSIWTALALVSYAVLKYRAAADWKFLSVFYAILKVFPVVLVASTYIAFILQSIASLILTPECSVWWGYVGRLISSFLFLVFYLPLSFAVLRDPEQPDWRVSILRARVTAMVAIAVSLGVQVCQFAFDLDASARPVAALASRAIHARRDDPIRDQARANFADTRMGGCLSRKCSDAQLRAGYTETALYDAARDQRLTAITNCLLL